MLRLRPRRVRSPGRLVRSVVLASILAALPLAPARAGPSPFPPIDFGTVPVGTAGSYDVVVPLTLAFSAIPADYDGITLLDATGNALLAAALDAVTFPPVVTIGVMKSKMAAASIVASGLTMSISGVTGGLSLTSLGCTSSQCAWRVGWDLAAPGPAGAHLEVQVASVAIEGGGILGDLLSLVYPLLAQFLASYLHYDFTVTAAAPPPPPALSAAAPVPGPGGFALAGLAFALAVAGAFALSRRRGR